MVSTQNTGTSATNGFDADRYKVLSDQFNAIVKRTQATMMMERLWPATIAPLCTGGLFLTTSWLGLWGGLPPVAKMAGVGAFAIVAAISLAPLALQRKSFSVSRQEAIARLDDTLGDPSHPAFMLNDHISTSASQNAHAVWDTNRLSMLQQWVDKFTIERKKSHVSIWPICAIAASVAVTAFTAAPHRLERLTEAFNWQTPPAPVIAKAWITPPDNFRENAMIIDQNTKDETHGGKPLDAHKNSKMTIIIYNKNTTVTLNGSPLTASRTSIAKEGTNAKSTFQYDINLAVGRNAININNEIFWSVGVAADNAPTAAIRGIVPNPKDPTSNELEYTEKDDYGVEGSEVIITLPAAPNPEATPLPSSSIPSVQLR